MTTTFNILSQTSCIEQSGKCDNSPSKFDVILADVPWDFEVWNRDTGSWRSASAHYPTMTLDDICQLPVKSLAANNCALFFWAVWPRLFDAKTVIEAWGFDYTTLGVEWWKLNKNWTKHYLPMGLLLTDYHILERLFFMGMGYYGRANSEPCLLAIKGNMPVAVHDERNFIIAPVTEHSRKPDEQYRKIEVLYPGRRYLELFARRPRPGWTSLGNAIDGRDIRDSLQALANPYPVGYPNRVEVAV